MHQVDFLCLKNGHYFCMHKLAHKRTQWPTPFGKWFCHSEANRHEICTRLRQRVRIEIGRILPEFVKFHSMKLTMMSKLNLKKLRSSPIDLLCITGWRQKSIYFSYKMTTNIHIIDVPKIVQIGWRHHDDFCLWKNRPLLLAKGVCKKKKQYLRHENKANETRILTYWALRYM